MKKAQISVEYIDHLGTDLNVVNAARVSFNKESEFEYSTGDENLPDGDFWEDVTDLDKDTSYVYRRLNTADQKLIKYLVKHEHWTPLAHTSITVRCKVPLFLAAQLKKHVVGLVFNEVSRRYVDHTPEFWFPDIWRERADNVKQGSKPTGVEAQWKVAAWSENTVNHCLDTYNNLLSAGVAPELARTILPQNTMTEFIWTGSAVAFARVIKQRSYAGAQLEAQEFAAKLKDAIKNCYPVTLHYLLGEDDA